MYYGQINISDSDSDSSSAGCSQMYFIIECIRVTATVFKYMISISVREATKLPATSPTVFHIVIFLTGNICPCFICPLFITCVITRIHLQELVWADSAISLRFIFTFRSWSGQIQPSAYDSYSPSGVGLGRLSRQLTIHIHLHELFRADSSCSQCMMHCFIAQLPKLRALYYVNS